MHDEHKQALVALMIEQQVLKFGDFTLKSGRHSPYFFNLGAISSGASIASLGNAYARRILQLDFSFDVLFGPAYKGIPIVVAAAQALAQMGADVSWVFNRKGRPPVRLGSGELAALAMGCLDVREARQAGRIDVPNRTAAGVLQALFPQCPMWQPPLDW